MVKLFSNITIICYNNRMAEHKVPQDVEAEDKLLGPLSFRQFIYAMIAVGSGALAYFLATTIAPPLAIIPLPVFLVFGILAIPRKGQPMEVYIGALIHFYFQPTKRLWDPETQENMVEITNPVIDTAPLIKDIGGSEAAQRLSFLADVVDTQGWSTRGNINMNDDFAAAASTVTDVLDDTSLNQVFDDKLAQSEKRAREEAIARMNIAAATPAPAPVSVPAPTNFAAPAIVTPPPVVVATPVSVTPAQTTPATSAAAPVIDEAALSAMLKQSTSASSVSIPAFPQTVATAAPLPTPTHIASQAVAGAPLPVATPTPADNTATTQTPAPAAQTPSTAAAQSVQDDDIEEEKVKEVEVEEQPDNPSNNAVKSDISDTIDKYEDTSDIIVEAVISHNSDSDNDEGGEISLH